MRRIYYCKQIEDEHACVGTLARPDSLCLVSQILPVSEGLTIIYDLQKAVGAGLKISRADVSPTLAAIKPPLCRCVDTGVLTLYYIEGIGRVLTSMVWFLPSQFPCGLKEV